MCAVNFGEDVADGGLVGYVDGMHRGAAAGFLNERNGFREFIFRARKRRDVRAFGGECLRDGAADAAPCASDNGDLSSERVRRSYFLLRHYGNSFARQDFSIALR